MIYDEDFQEIIDCLEIKEYGSFSEEIEEHIIINDKKDYYSFYQTPFFRWVLDKLEDENVKVIGLMLPAQIGKTQLLTAIALEFARRYPSKKVLYYNPDENLASSFASDRLITCVKNSTTYEELIKECKNGAYDRSAFTTKGIKFTNGSEIVSLNANAKNAFRGLSSPLVILDELAAYKSSDGEDKFSQALTRTTSYSNENNKVIAASTPLNENETIHKLHKESRQYTWVVPCPECKTDLYLDFENLKWIKPEDNISDVVLGDMLASESLRVFYECPHCKRQIEEHEKKKMLNAGKMVCNGNEYLSEKQISINLNGLYNLRKWSEIASIFVKSKGDITKQKVFRNEVLAAPWEEKKKIDKLFFESFTFSEYPKKTVPENTYNIVCGLDVQDNRYYYTLLAYTLDKKIHLIDWGMPDFNLLDPYNPESFPFRLLEEEYGNGLKVDMILLDSGDGANKEINYELAKRLERCYPIKGTPKDRLGLVSKWSNTNKELLLVSKQDSNTLLDDLISAKQFIFPNGLEEKDDIIQHLMNVVKKNGNWDDRKQGARTDYRDAIRYALAWIKLCNYSDEVDDIIRRENNKDQIEKKNKDNEMGLREFFGGL